MTPGVSPSAETLLPGVRLCRPAGPIKLGTRRAQILRLLGSMPFAKDVLVATAANVARPLIGSALADAVREGVTVYER